MSTQPHNEMHQSQDQALVKRVADALNRCHDEIDGPDFEDLARYAIAAIGRSRIGYEAVIPRRLADVVVAMPGLARIDLSGDTAMLTFLTAPGCEPCGDTFIWDELERLGARPMRVREVAQ